jgi:hypothetical protein
MHRLNRSFSITSRTESPVTAPPYFTQSLRHLSVAHLYLKSAAPGSQCEEMSVPYFDPLGETEPNTTRYTLTVMVPPRPPPRWLPSIFTNKPSTQSRNADAHKLPTSNSNPNLDLFELKDIDVLATKTVTIKSAWFPAEMRCAHVQNAQLCEEGCYFLEKGGDVTRWWCKREDCEGHVYCGRAMMDDEGRSCFGKKGGRMVCLEK